MIAIEKKTPKICGIRQRLHRHRRQEVFAQVQLHQVGQLHKGVIGDGAQLTAGQKELLQVDETALLEGPRGENLKVVGVQVEHLRRGRYLIGNRYQILVLADGRLLAVSPDAAAHLRADHQLGGGCGDEEGYEEKVVILEGGHCERRVDNGQQSLSLKKSK